MPAPRRGKNLEAQAWAYPVMEDGRGREPDAGSLLSTSDSELRFIQTQIDDRFDPPDWYPDEHPIMPEVVAHGRPALVCAVQHAAWRGTSR